MAISPADRDAALRALLFVPCETREHLQNWVHAFLGIDLPNCTVCDDDVDNPASNSNPMDLLWEVYQAARDGRDPSKTQYLFYASRDSWKSLVASIIEILCLFHLDRDCAHLAAILSQAKNVQRYLKNYLKRPVLRDFLTSKNEMTIEVTRYEQDGKIISPIEWKALDPENRKLWTPKEHWVQIIVATMSGTNSLHCSMVIMDELDLAPPKPVEEAMMIASPGKERGELPMILMTSSRKFGHGLVQRRIDNADKLGINLRHWNLIDSAAPCPPERHLPEKPRLPIYYSEEELVAIPEAQYQSLVERERVHYKVQEGYAGCLEKCRIFAQCRGRLATKQKSTSKLLKSIDAVQATFRRVSAEVARSQLMCWKPSTEGMIFPSLQSDLHIITPARMASLITGEQHPATMTKAEFVTILRDHDAVFAAGLDWGFAHPFGGTLAAIVGHWAFVIDAWEISDLDNTQQIEICNERLKPYDPIIYADTAYPGMIKEFQRRGFRMRKWKKGPGSVLDGIESVRVKLRPLVGSPQMYFMKGQPGPELLFRRMAAYHWKTDSEGSMTSIPDDTDDDVVDSCRYLIMNVFGKGSRIVVGHADEGSIGTPEPLVQGGLKVYDQNNWAQQVIAERMGTVVEDIPTAAEPASKKGNVNSSFFFDLG